MPSSENVLRLPLANFHHNRNNSANSVHKHVNSVRLFVALQVHEDDEQMSDLRLIPEFPPFIDDDADIKPFRIDAWLAASLLQKAIRRGDREVAERAALTLYYWRGTATWRRLIIIASEDIGIASVDAVTRAVEAACDPALRRRLGDFGVLLNIVRELAASPKDRSADLLASIVHHHPSLDKARAEIGAMSVSERIKLAANPSADFYCRAVAAWHGSGMEWGLERRVGRGDVSALLSAYQVIGIPRDWLQAVLMAARRTREPLTVMLPLLWLEQSRTGNRVIRCPLPATREVGGLSLYALDKHTRLGKAALQQFARENTQVRETFQKFVPKRNAPAAVQWAAFYADAASLAESIVWPRGKEIEKLGIEADLLNVGIPLDGIGAIREVIQGNIDHLNDIREQLLVAYLGGAQ